MNQPRIIMFTLTAALILSQNSIAATLYADRASFHAAAPGLSIEGFETPFSASTSVGFSGFTASHNQPPHLMYFTGIVSQGTGSLHKGGWAGAGESTVTFAFDTPISAFAVDILDFGSAPAEEGVLSVSNSPGSLSGHVLATNPSTPEGINVFFGFVDDVPFSFLAVSTTTLGDAIVFDYLEFGVPVPEPSALLLLALGGLMLLWRRVSPAAQPD